MARTRRLRESKEKEESDPKKKDNSSTTSTGALSVGLQPSPTNVTPYRKENNNMSDKISSTKTQERNVTPLTNMTAKVDGKKMSMTRLKSDNSKMLNKANQTYPFATVPRKDLKSPYPLRTYTMKVTLEKLGN